MKKNTGNILDVTAGTILHQVNCRGVVGGLAGALYDKYPAAFAEYFEHCNKNGFMALDSFLACEAAPGLFIAHVFGQIQPGANTDMHAVNRSLFEGSNMELIGPIYAPYKMGCGLGGGNWPEYLEELEQFFPDITIVRRPGD